MINKDRIFSHALTLIQSTGSTVPPWQGASGGHVLVSSKEI